MSAQTKLTNKRQSLEHQCRDRRHSLLQLFAKAELMMALRLGDDSPKMFGDKLKATFKIIQPRKDWLSLATPRNLLAHAFVEVFEKDGEFISVWRVADTANGLNAHTMNEAELRAWDRAVADRVRQLITALEKRPTDTP